MANRKTKLTVTSGRPVRQFPPEAYDYEDDVTPEGMALVRERAGVDLSKRRVKQLDGYGCLVRVGAS